MAAAASAYAQDDRPLWSGWYAGVNAGANWGNSSHHLLAAPNGGAVFIPPSDIAAIQQIGAGGGNPAGFAGGVEAGYNYRSGSILLGLETDGGFNNLEQKRFGTFQSAVVQPIFPPPAPAQVTIGQKTTTDWMWTLRPRVGYVTGPWLFYATGGMALADVKLTTSYSDTFMPTPHSGSASTTPTKVGWTAGAGIGYALTPRWSIKGEWLYVDLGRVSQSFPLQNGYAVINSSTQARTNVIRLGVDYRF
jgi:outer membrane immunogenic protein